MMKALVYTAPFTLGIEDLPVPEPDSNEVLIRVKAVGICGSDVLGYTGTTGRRLPPLIMGHEAAGIVAQVGPDVHGIQEGAPVCFDSTIYCNACTACDHQQHNRCVQRSVLGVSVAGMKRHGAMAEYVTVPSWVLHTIPGSLSFEAAALLEPVSIGMHAVSRAQTVKDAVVLIIGAGPIGLCTLSAAKIQNPGTVVVTDLDARRLDLARTMGANETAYPDALASKIEQLTDGKGADVVFEAVGVAQTIAAALDTTRTGGTVVLVGNVAVMPPVDIQKVVSRELTLTGSYASAGEYAEALRLVADGAIDPRPLISGVFPLEQGPACFDRLHRGKEDSVKILLRP